MSSQNDGPRMDAMGAFSVVSALIASIVVYSVRGAVNTWSYFELFIGIYYNALLSYGLEDGTEECIRIGLGTILMGMLFAGLFGIDFQSRVLNIIIATVQLLIAIGAIILAFFRSK